MGGEMGILAMQVFAVWFMVALVAGFGLGAIIHKAECMRENEFLALLFSRMARRQTSH
jgi:hypothetical protein